MTCVICKTGTPEPGRTTATFDREGVVVVIQRVPAEVCPQCGEPYYDATTTERLLELVNRAIEAGSKLEVRDYAAA
jgi:YgiT-type zinc finger domain-containing protein